MKKIYCLDCNKYKKFLNPKISYVFDKALVLFIIFSKCGYNNNKIFKEGERTEIGKLV